MSLYYLPALIGLASKLFILAYALRGKDISNSFIYLIGIFACHNAIELIGYLRFFDDQAVAALFRSYYVATIFMLFMLPLHAFLVSKISKTAISTGIGIAALLLSIAVLATDTVIAGTYSIGYSLSAIKGPYFMAFVLYVFVTLGINITVLLYGHKTAKNQLDAIQCLYSLVATAPLVIVCALAITFKMFNIGINAAGILPIATTLFLLVVLKSEKSHQLTDIRRLLPFSLENRTASEVLRLMDAYAQATNKTDSFYELRKGLETQAILYTLKKCDDNVTQAAQMMGLQNRSTLYSMMKRLGIENKDGVKM